MVMGKPILSLDQGTTSSRAIVFGQDGRPLSVAQRELPQIYPAPGDVEHDPEEIWQTQLACAREALARAGLSASQIGSLGITNQRETTILWDKATGKPVANAIVWQSRVSAPVCDRLKAQGHESLIRQRTGLVVDAYFSGTKVVHLLETIPGLRERAAKGEILFGTVDTWLIWKLTGGKLHVTDVSNASRTLLFDIHRLDWDDEILGILNIPRVMLPRVVDSSGVAGQTDAEMLGAPVAIAGIAGDQQAATFGQACFQPGSAKQAVSSLCALRRLSPRLSIFLVFYNKWSLLQSLLVPDLLLFLLLGLVLVSVLSSLLSFQVLLATLMRRTNSSALRSSDSHSQKQSPSSRSEEHSLSSLLFNLVINSLIAGQLSFFSSCLSPRKPH